MSKTEGRSARHIEVSNLALQGGGSHGAFTWGMLGRLIDEGRVDPTVFRRVLVYVLNGEDKMPPLGASSKLNAEWDFLVHLRDLGRAAAGAWIERHLDDVGLRSTVDVAAVYGGSGAGPAG